MRSILVHAFDDGDFSRRIDIALDLARAFGGHLTFVHTMPYAVAPMADPQAGAFAAMIPIWREQAAKLKEDTERDLANEDVPWDWHEAAGPPALGLLKHSSLADIILIGAREPEDRGGQPSFTAGELAISAACPVLVLPEGQDRFDPAGPALVAWDGSPEASHALKAAMPLLEKASTVYLASVEERKRLPGGDLPVLTGADYLAHHGISCEMVELSNPGEAGVASALRRAAEHRECSLMVMGAYGRNRLAERVFGGATRETLSNVRIPVLMKH